MIPIGNMPALRLFPWVAGDPAWPMMPRDPTPRSLGVDPAATAGRRAKTGSARRRRNWIRLNFEDVSFYTTGCSENQSKAAVADEIEGGVAVERGEGVALAVDGSACEAITTQKIACRAPDGA
jgi:hypothetical protein